MNFRNVAVAIVAILGVSLPNWAFAATSVVWSSIPDLYGPSTNYGLWCSTCYGSYEVLDEFTLTQNETITGFNLVTGGIPGYARATQFTIEIYNSEHDQIIFSEPVSSTFVGDTVDTIDLAEVVTGQLSGLQLSAGNYWFAAVNDYSLGLPGYSG